MESSCTNVDMPKPMLQNEAFPGEGGKSEPHMLLNQKHNEKLKLLRILYFTSLLSSAYKSSFETNSRNDSPEDTIYIDDDRNLNASNSLEFRELP